MVREAGGQVTDYMGRPWQLTSRSLIASNGQPTLHEAMISGVQNARKSVKIVKLPVSEL
jgi:myo-inositol-1(or 4)-monophosphatase